MNKEQLQDIFRQPYNAQTWQELLINLFGASEIRQTPSELVSDSNEKVEGFQLGSLTTTDRYEIGLFAFEIKGGMNLKLNRVGLRSLVRSYIKYQVDTAIVVYYDKEHWRLSFICDIPKEEEKTDSKRYTYVFGNPDESYKTAADRLSKLVAKPSFEQIKDAFSVEALNAEFYKVVANQFYKLLGATTGKGKSQVSHQRVMQLPGEEPNLTYQEFAVRLIGRSVFCWFLKEKKSNDGIALLPNSLLSSKSVESNRNYYHSILERIFFQTLSTPMGDRVKDLPEGCEQIPFLNGGLFDYQPHDFYIPTDTGLSANSGTLTIPDEWFLEFFKELEQYNFTIDENSTNDVEVSVDPEMLGRIFENLLAEIDPDSGETARKATGSFYTPREIVDYMAIESLTQYLHNKTTISKDRVYTLFSSDEKETFTTQEKENLLKSLDELKVIDPACGSGAFPIGVLQKMIGMLQKLDKDCSWWKARQVERIDNVLIRKQIQEKLDGASMEYARKMGVIQNSLYGVDIQPVAAEISKLRCFLTLIVDENIDDSKPNRGVEPLPNLEFKFVTADSLLKLPEANDFGGLFGRDDYEETNKLKQLRIDYLQSYGKQKAKIKAEFIAAQKKIYERQMDSSTIDTNSRAYKISQWNPFVNEKSDWFDPEWMFGLENGFDIVIGNPPFISLSKIDPEAKKKYKELKYKTFENTGDIYALFYERGYQLLGANRVLTFISSRQWMQASYGKSMRKFLAAETNPIQLIDFGQVKIFDQATVFVNILEIEKSTGKGSLDAVLIPTDYNSRTDLRRFFNENKISIEKLSESTWAVSQGQSINEKMEKIGKPIKDWAGFGFYRGITSGLNEAFHINGVRKKELTDKNSKNNEIIKPLLRGKDIKRYNYDYQDLHIINTHNGVREFGLPRVDVIADYPDIYEHLLQWESDLTERLDKGEHWTNLRNCAFLLEFEKPKIVWIEISDRANYTYDDKGMFLTNSAYFLTCDSEKTSLKYLLAVLNSKVADFYFSQKTARIAGGRMRYTKQYVEQIPIPEISLADQQPFIELVDKILAIKASNPTDNTNKLEREIDLMVYALYNLTPDEIALIEK